MSLFTKYLDAVSAYAYGKKNENVQRSNPPEKSVEELSAAAEALFDQLVIAKVKEYAPAAANTALNQSIRGM
ncbi:hypothetical protein E3T43_12775 [Cryobacterium sp. Hh7]|uniref:hypothetical protein n=1 Tax=Cryobacterium sp. Hh7 TaxID=1259159 RepID=UPI00106C559F|nr:hypothetical protein [Cryobacterium sp. Hh7]TFD54395.1 hypothetical protein E3T43_12775 [Cryobacterium sp. Hh7]